MPFSYRFRGDSMKHALFALVAGVLFAAEPDAADIMKKVAENQDPLLLGAFRRRRYQQIGDFLARQFAVRAPRRHPARATRRNSGGPGKLSSM
jgi:hypothetical protein